MYRILLVCVILTAVNSSIYSQSNTLIQPKPTPPISPSPDVPPGNMVLIDGYIHAKKKGIDTSVGEIQGATSLVIHYDNGRLAGNVAWRMHTELPRRNVRVMWYKEQKVNGLSLYLIRGEDRSIYATFPETCANFYAFKVDEPEFADFLLMIMTYREQPNKNVRMKGGRPTC